MTTEEITEPASLRVNGYNLDLSSSLTGILWWIIYLDAMKYCLMMKYQQSEEFRSSLLQTKGLFIVEDQTSFPKKTADTWGTKLVGDEYVGPNLLGRLLMELRDNGNLTYSLPEDALRFLDYL